MSANELSNLPVQFPLLPLRDVVVFPHMVIPLFVGRPKSIKAMEMAMEAGKSILLVAQKSAAKDEPAPEDMYDIGCISNILQMLKLPDGTVKVLVEGSQRARIQDITDQRTHYSALATPVPPDPVETTEVEAMRRALIAQFDQYVKLNKKIPPESSPRSRHREPAGLVPRSCTCRSARQKRRCSDATSSGSSLLAVQAEIDILQVEKRIRGA
jgi:ATP-dependent Lon protease